MVIGNLRVPGAPAVDAPVTLRNGTASSLLAQLGDGFSVLVAGAVPPELHDIDGQGLAVKLAGIGLDLRDPDGLVAQRYDLRPGTAYLIRPDQHVCARWRRADADRINIAIRHALALA